MIIKGNVNSLGIIKCFKSIKKTITKKQYKIIKSSESIENPKR